MPRALAAGSVPHPSRHSESLLRSRESQRIHTAFMILDREGMGRLDGACAEFVDDIPAEQDRKIVAHIIAHMNRRMGSNIGSRRTSNAQQSAAAASAASAANEEKQSDPSHPNPTFAGGSMLAPPRPDWTLDIVEFSALFAREQKRLSQREGPQGTEGLRSGRQSAATSRAVSGATTPTGAVYRRRGSGSHFRSQSARHSRSNSADARPFVAGGVSGSRRNSSGAFDGSLAALAASDTGVVSDGEGAGRAFTPHLNAHSEALAEKNRRDTLEAMRAEQQRSGANSPALSARPASGRASRPGSLSSSRPARASSVSPTQVAPVNGMTIQQLAAH